jgi:hypothetical protein
MPVLPVLDSNYLVVNANFIRFFNVFYGKNGLAFVDNVLPCLFTLFSKKYGQYFPAFTFFSVTQMPLHC